MSAQLAVAVAVEKFADCGPGKWWFVHHPDGFLIECALQQRAEQIAAEINVGRSNSPDLSLVQASAAEDRRTASAAPITPSAASVPPRAPKAGEVPPSGLASTHSPEREPGSPEVCAISIPMRVSSGTSRPAARAHLNAENQASPAGEPVRKSIRPNCLRPDLCAGVGHKHCHACTKAMAQSEAA